MTCACGAPVYIKKRGQCRTCYMRDYHLSSGRTRVYERSVGDPCVKCGQRPARSRREGLCKVCIARSNRVPRATASSSESSRISQELSVVRATISGETANEIAGRLNVSPSWVRLILGRCGVDPRRLGKYRTSLKNWKPPVLRGWDSARARFDKYVQTGGPDECWLWTGAKMDPTNGRCKVTQFYGHLSVSADKKQPKSFYAHRLAWQFANGPIPDGLTVDHICWNTLCCNPAHLQLLTLGENSRRKRPDNPWNDPKWRKAQTKHLHKRLKIYQAKRKQERLQPSLLEAA